MPHCLVLWTLQLQLRVELKLKMQVPVSSIFQKLKGNENCIKPKLDSRGGRTL